ncbi:DUF1963 domain-containing protein [Gymnodinialimonas hymeniacidonis]|uniref:DUF1963 domain-containing protein n=1 Tax=Gymnodinialimonas hymeniacidonis TaxID=3126508 RepID=UPI0034C6315F
MGLFADRTFAIRALEQHTDLAEADIAQFIARARPALTFRRHITPEDEVPLGASKIGGRPDMGADLPWPIRAPYEGVVEAVANWPEALRNIYSPEWIDAYIAYNSAPAPLGFIAQFDLDTLSSRSGFDPNLPRTGRLLLFTDPSGHHSADAMASAQWVQVIHDTTPRDQIIRHTTPEALIEHWSTSVLMDQNQYYGGPEAPWSETADCERLDAVDAISLPHDRAWQAPQSTLDILRALRVADPTGLEDATVSDYAAGISFHGDQLGGHPIPVQDSVPAEIDRLTDGALGPVEGWRFLFHVQGETYLPQLMTDWRDGDLYLMDQPPPAGTDSIGEVFGVAQST